MIFILKAVITVAMPIEMHTDHVRHEELKWCVEKSTACNQVLPFNTGGESGDNVTTPDDDVEDLV